MKFFMYANGMPFNAETLEQGKSLGGSETMAYLVARELAEREHSVIMFSNAPQQAAKQGDVTYVPIGAIDQRQFPFGSNFERYAKDVPCDVILAQRVAGIFAKPYNSKLNYFWAHDLALKRFQGQTNAMLWGIDRYLTVSDFHKKQTQAVYGVPEEILHTLPNGVDLSLWGNTPVSAEAKMKSKTMLYAARPERGLIHLVKQDGIMERLLQFDPEIKLLVCTYDFGHPNAPGMADYRFLYDRCQQLPNVENIGSQSQQQLAQIEKNCWLYVYPTEFEDTSCLMVMQNAAAGTPFIACKAGALEETAKGSGVYWAALDKFERTIMYLAENPSKYKQLYTRSLDKAQDYSITRTVDTLEEYIYEDFKKLTANKQKVYDHFVYTSEIYGADILRSQSEEVIEETEQRKVYKTDVPDLVDTGGFYAKAAERNFELGNQHGMNNPAGLLNMGRLQPVIQYLSMLAPNARVLDYGCCVGQLAFALKTRFPDMQFVCTDISEAQLEIGLTYAEENKIPDITFLQCTSPAELQKHERTFDAILALEVLEHVWEHNAFLNDFCKLVKIGGKVILSTPFGPYEHNSEDPDPLYQHLHNFEETDIKDMVGKKQDFNVVYTSDADSKKGEKLGNYIWSWTEEEDQPIMSINWDRKLNIQRPRQQVSACLIVGPDGDTLGRCLKSIAPLTDELILGVDDPDWQADWDLCNYATYVQNSSKRVYQIGREHNATFVYIQSPTKQGFAEARNQTIDKATKDWILWIDDDETFVHTERFSRFLRSTVFDCFSINHHHMTAEPAGLLKTDHPTRVFKTNKNIRFFGIVHEHPETAINEGPGKVFTIPAPLGCIMHYGYESEEIRRKRFMRNFPLMKRDRELNPERKLGKFLWIRDLAHLNRFIMEKTGGRVTEEVLANCRDAISMWRGELKNTNLRMLQDSLQYISECVNIITGNKGIHFKIALDVNSRGIGDNMQVPVRPVFEGMVEKQEDIAALQNVLLRDKLSMAETAQVYI